MFDGLMIYSLIYIIVVYDHIFIVRPMDIGISDRNVGITKLSRKNVLYVSRISQLELKLYGDK